MFVCFGRVKFCTFSLPLGIREWLRFVIVTLPGRFINFFICILAFASTRMNLDITEWKYLYILWMGYSDNIAILLYKGLKGKASVPTDDLIPKTRRCRNQHSMAFQTPIANTDVYKGSFFPKTIRDWNALPDSLISSAEYAEDCVAKFTSLVRARD